MNNINIIKPDLKKPHHLIAFGFGSGLLKPAPGTWGSLFGLLLAILLTYFFQQPLFFIFLSLISFIIGYYVCEKTSNDLGLHDDGRIVWDEITAIFFIFAFLPEIHLPQCLIYLAIFVLFRLFDILKPYPIRYFDEKLKGGFGIMFDDILAALYTLIGLYLLSFI